MAPVGETILRQSFFLPIALENEVGGLSHRWRHFNHFLQYGDLCFLRKTVLRGYAGTEEVGFFGDLFGRFHKVHKITRRRKDQGRCAVYGRMEGAFGGVVDSLGGIVGTAKKLATRLVSTGRNKNERVWRNYRQTPCQNRWWSIDAENKLSFILQVVARKYVE